MKDRWLKKPLGEVCENLDSRRIPITKSKRVSGDIPYYGASGIVDYVADYIFDEDLLLVSEDGANLLARTYPIAFSISGKTWINNHAHALKFDNMGSQKFIEYYLNSIKLDDYVSGMAQPKLNQKMLYSIPVPYPKIETQEKIVAKLDECFEAIDKARANVEKNLHNAKELFQSQLNQIFSQKGDGWVDKKLGEVCDKITQGPNPKLKNDIPSKGNYILKTKDFYNHVILYDNCLGVSKTLMKEWERFILKDDDIIIGLVGVGSIGKCNIFKKQDNRKYIFTRATGLIRCNQSIINPEFLHYYLVSPIGEELIKIGIGGTTGQLVIKTSYLKNASISFPSSIHSQLNIVKKVETLFEHSRKLQSNYQQELDALDELKKSILQKAFNGEL